MELPAHEPEVRNLVLNMRIEAANPFVSKSVWEANVKEPGPLEGRVWAGLDLSSVHDLTALVLVSPQEAGLLADDKAGTTWEVHPTFWLPGQSLRDKAKADRVSYDVWADQGHLEATAGAVVDYAFVAARLLDARQKYDLRKVAFDRWNYAHLKPRLSEAGFSDEELDGDDAIFVPFGQGFGSMSPALQELESAILTERLVHGGHPVLEMCAKNAVVRTDPAGNRKLAKNKSRGRIDGMVALAMAMSVAGQFENVRREKSFWEVM